MKKQKYNEQIRSQNPMFLLYTLIIVVFLAAALLKPTPAISAPFDSGSTGVDGAFAPTTDTTLTLPPNGVFNFTTVNIPAGVTVTFTPNATNTPVTMLASGDVAIEGTISVNGQDGTSVDTPDLAIPIGSGGTGGSGGFAGGAGGLSQPFNGGILLSPGQGLGPGGAVKFGCGGVFAVPILLGFCATVLEYGNITLVPLIGGSGGAGGQAKSTFDLVCTNGCNGGGGGGGGGAILVASSAVITINGSITANGGNKGNGNVPGGSGSGGGIRLMANTIAGAGAITATPGVASSTVVFGTVGRIRLEANTFSFSGPVNPSPTVSTPGLVNLSPLPTLSITAVAGVPAPLAPAGSFTSPDITLPSSTTNPVALDLAASNIPVGTIVKVHVKPRNDTGSVSDSTPLSGTEASSTATASVNLSTTVPNNIRAETTFTVLTASNPFPTFAEGEKVEQVRVATTFGGNSSIILITESGREVLYQGVVAE